MRNRPLIFLLTITAFCIAGLSYSQEPGDSELPGPLDDKYQDLLEKVQTEINSLHEEVNDTDSDSRENIRGTVLSTNLVTFSDIPGELDRQIAGQQEAIASLIESVARDYETTNSTGIISVDQDGLAYDDLPGEVKDEIDQMQEAGSSNNRTIMTVFFTMKLFSDVNNQLIEQALAATSPRDQLRLYSLQAALVYELGKIAIDVLNEVDLEGTETLERIRNENQARVSNRIADANSQIQMVKTKVNEGLLDAEIGDSTERNLMLLTQSNQAIMLQWDSLVEDALDQVSFMDRLPELITRVEIKMELSRLQLETLRDVGVIAVALDSMAALEGIALTYSDMPILDLDRAKVMELLGLASLE